MKVLPSVFILLLILAACGDTPTQAPAPAQAQAQAQSPVVQTVEVTRVVEVTKIVEVTRLVAAPTNTLAPTSTITPTAKPTIAQPVTTAVLNATTAPAQSGGTTGSANGESIQELIGQTGTYKDQKITVTAADRYTELVGKTKTVKSQGYFIILAYDVDNSAGKDPGGFFFAKLVDGKGRTFTTSANSDALYVMIVDEPFRTKYKADLSIQPGFKGKAHEIYEVPIDASNLMIKFGF